MTRSHPHRGHHRASHPAIQAQKRKGCGAHRRTSRELARATGECDGPYGQTYSVQKVAPGDAAKHALFAVSPMFLHEPDLLFPCCNSELDAQSQLQYAI